MGLQVLFAVSLSLQITLQERGLERVFHELLRNARRVLLKPARDSRARGLGPKRNQFGDRSGVKLKWTQIDIFRLQELGFVLHKFFNLFINT